jgi:hypothetical protein
MSPAASRGRTVEPVEGRIEGVPDRLFEGEEPVLHVIERGQHRSAFVTLDSSDCVRTS